MKHSIRKPKNQHEALLALSMVHQLGIQRIRLLLQAVDHPAQIFSISGSELQSIDGIGKSLVKTIIGFDNWGEVDRILERTRKTGAQIISFQDDAYPPILREIYDPPLLLWVKGNPAALNMPAVAVVGTRRASKYGLRQATIFGKELAQRGITIVSGLAYGVDAVSHKAALDAGGKTVAVLGSGIDNIYPAKHSGLAREIVEHEGAVISEFPPGTNPDAGNFPLRNRIVSGMSLGILVVESGLKGGSMITAQSALMQNREVFVIPHALELLNGEGCNHLIKRSAGKLVQTVDDILEELPLQFSFQNKPAESITKPRESKWRTMDLDEESRTICKALENRTYYIDDLSAELGMPSHTLLAKLLQLEMQECVRQTSGKNFEIW